MKPTTVVLTGCVFVSLWPAWCVCFSHGGTFTSCVDMKPGHMGSEPQHTHTPSAVTIHTSRMVYLPRHTLTVSVRSSRAFMGFLLQARAVTEDRVVGGEFRLHPPGTHTLSCMSSGDTVTHSDKLLKRNLSFTWRAPLQPAGDLRFYITVVHSYFVHWTRIRSTVVHDGTLGSRRDSGVEKSTISASLMTSHTQTHTAAPTITGSNRHTLTTPLTTFTQTHTLGAYSTHKSRNYTLTTTHTTILTETHTQIPPTNVRTHTYTDTNIQLYSTTQTPPTTVMTHTHIDTNTQLYSTTQTPSTTTMTHTMPPSNLVSPMPVAIPKNTAQMSHTVTTHTTTLPTTTLASAMPTKLLTNTTQSQHNETTHTLTFKKLSRNNTHRTTMPTHVPRNTTQTHYTGTTHTTTMPTHSHTHYTETTHTTTMPTHAHTHYTGTTHTTTMPTHVPRNTTHTSHTVQTHTTTLPATTNISSIATHVQTNTTQTHYIETTHTLTTPRQVSTNTTQTHYTKTTHTLTTPTTILASSLPTHVPKNTTHTSHTEITHTTTMPTTTGFSFTSTQLLLPKSDTQTTQNTTLAFATLPQPPISMPTSYTHLIHTRTRTNTMSGTQDLTNTHSPSLLTHTLTRPPYIRTATQTPLLNTLHANTTPLMPSIRPTSRTPASNTHTLNDVPKNIPTSQRTHTSFTPIDNPETRTLTLPTHTHQHTLGSGSSSHLEPSPPLRRSLYDPVKPSDRAEEVVLTNTDVVSVLRPEDEFKVGGGVTPESEPGLTSPAGLLLGITLALLVVLVIYVRRKMGVKRHRMSLSENSRRSDERWRAEECGELVRLRRIRENSLLLLQAQYDLITGATGS